MITIGDKLSLIACDIVECVARLCVGTDRKFAAAQQNKPQNSLHRHQYSRLMEIFMSARHPNCQSPRVPRRLPDGLTMVSSMPIGH
ncbi:hypothetical protein AS156_21615 [Bradyrhizobium macuxiense]|uniref:Uncharacterized protein n=2 Tax=Bradyrhizobium macuxiense TaxID=1755647 RepID=A0A109JCC2_9BRAD|nr:hypothetical protein AS156_21615 [Bradyrhizobium macuxiense]